MKRLVLFAILFCELAFASLAQDKDTGFDGYSRLLSPEKLYLHTDREVYNIGDTIWFRGYLKNASALAEYRECNYLYVELISSRWEVNQFTARRSEENHIRQRVKIKRDNNGMFVGYLPLNEDNNTGLATLRAYSYWALNEEPEYLYTKNIELINPMKDEFLKNMVEAEMTEQSMYDEMGVENPFKKTLFQKKEKTEYDVDLQFMPESGRYLPGVPSVVAVKAINGEGLGVKVSGIVQSGGTVFATFTTNNLGMGKFEINVPPDAKALKAYAETYVDNFECETDFPLPEAAGVAINAFPDSQGVSISVNNMGFDLPDSLFLIIYDKSQIVLKSLYSESLSGKRVDYRELEPGINTIAVVDSHGNVYAERPFFVYPDTKPVVLSSLDKPAYGRREKVQMSFQIKDFKGRPLDGSYSVSVTDDEYAPYSGEGHTIESYFLLGSELKGMVEKPQHYFTDTIPLAMRICDMDLLLLTQGWRYYDLEKILKGRISAPRFGKEYTQSLSGYVNGILGKSKRSTLCFLAPSINYRQIAELDSTAYFELNGLDFPDSTQFIVAAQGNGKLFKKWYAPILNPDYFATDFTYPNYLKSREYSEEYGQYAIQSYDTQDGSLIYTIAPSRITVTKALMLSPYPNDSFKKGQYRDEKMLAPYRDHDLFSYIAQTCPGVRQDGDRLVCRKVMVGSNMQQGDMWMPINIYLNGFHSSPAEMSQIMVSEVEAFAFINDSSADKYEWQFSGGAEYYLKPRYAVLVQTKWPVRGASNVTTGRPVGWQRPSRFYSPKYVSSSSRKAFEPMRSTLHWEPVLDTKDGMAAIEFYTSDHQVSYTVILEGITAQGGYVHYKTSIR